MGRSLRVEVLRQPRKGLEADVSLPSYRRLGHVEFVFTEGANTQNAITAIFKTFMLALI